MTKMQPKNKNRHFVNEVVDKMATML